MTEIINGTSNAVALKHITPKKKKKGEVKEPREGEGKGENKNIIFLINDIFQTVVLPRK